MPPFPAASELEFMGLASSAGGGSGEAPTFARGRVLLPEGPCVHRRPPSGGFNTLQNQRRRFIHGGPANSKPVLGTLGPTRRPKSHRRPHPQRSREVPTWPLRPPPLLSRSRQSRRRKGANGRNPALPEVDRLSRNRGETTILSKIASDIQD